MSTPGWALTLAYWLHMLATVFWIGGLVTLVLLVIPSMRLTNDPLLYSNLLQRIQKRLDPLGWFSIIVLGLTGLFQMSANPNYYGFISLNGAWATAIFVKHVLFLIMIAVSSSITWGTIPRLRRLAILQANQVASEGSEETTSLTSKIQDREAFLYRLNLILAVIVLGLTAVARAV